jgi:hypothetical protein
VLGTARIDQEQLDRYLDNIKRRIGSAHPLRGAPIPAACGAIFSRSGFAAWVTDEWAEPK